MGGPGPARSAGREKGTNRAQGAGETAAGSNFPSMWLRRLFDDLSALWAIPPSEADVAAGYQLAVSARRFSRRTKEVVDDKLTFSAALMRAGEVEEANRLLVEVERDVRDEEAALIEKVNEIKVARSIDRPPLTRVRLARALAAAAIGSSILMFSAVGMAVTGLFRDAEGGAVAAPEAGRLQSRAGFMADTEMRVVATRRIAGVDVQMTAGQLKTYRRLTSGGDEQGLESFLLGLLPDELARKVHYALVTAMEALPAPVADETAVLSKRLNKERQKATENEASEEASESQDEPSPEPSDGDEKKKKSDGSSDEDEDSGGVPLLDDTYGL